jgi:hypothetical protein
MPIYSSKFDRIGVCGTAADTQCIISWQTFAEGADTKLFKVSVEDFVSSPNDALSPAHYICLFLRKLSWHGPTWLSLDRSKSVALVVR